MPVRNAQRNHKAGNATGFHRSRRGYTLVEMVVASSLAAIVLLGTQSAVMIASKAIPKDAAGGIDAAAGSEVMNSLAEEIAFATDVAVTGANDIAFTVPDRTGDGAPDVVRYTWSGVSGASLYRTINGGTADVIAPGVTSFALTYDKTAVARTQTFTEGSEQRLHNFTTASSLDKHEVKKDKSFGQCFRPTLPNDASSWRMTTVLFYARKKDRVNAVVSVQLLASSAGQPTGAGIDQTTLLESSLGNGWTQVNLSFTNAAGLATGVPYIITMIEADDGNLEIEVQKPSTTTAEHHLLQSDDDGASWSIKTENLLLEVWGKVSTPNPLVYDYVLNRVSCAMTTTAGGAAPATDSWRVLNAPPVVGP